MKTIALLLLCFTLLHSDEVDEPEEFDPQFSITNHMIELPSGPLSYMAVTGLCPIMGPERIEAELFFISFTKDSEENRPITFIFPGGPGGAGTIESILTFGPRRLLTAEEGRTILPPYKIIDNPQTLLEYTDLVFVDPVNCGFSRAIEDADLNYYYSVEGDLETLGQFIHTFLDSTERWNSPIYLSGGSYGTVRCAGLSLELFQYGIVTSGIILDGCAIDYSTQQSERDQALPDCLLIPTFAATAWYHGRLWPEKTIEDVVDYAKRFAYDEYAPYMLQPSRLSYVEKLAFEKQLALLTGLPVDTIRRYNGRINETIYTSEFFGPQRKVLGGKDSRYSGDISTIDPNHSHDPSYLDSLGLLPAFKAYLQKELATHFPFTNYISFCYQAIHHWNFGTYDSFGPLSFIQRIRQTLVINPLMKVFVGSGYYDCRTPFASTEYCFDHIDLPPSYKNNFQFEYYEAGHGFIFDYPSLIKWKKDLTKFYGH
jgi:carboxypeptidase C (cathepsin A)